MKNILRFTPVLFAVYPVVFLYAHNVQEVNIGQIYFPLGVSLLSTLIIWGLLSLVIKDRLKAGLITIVFLIFFFSYGSLFDSLLSLKLFSVKHRHLFPIVLLIAGYLSYFILIIKRKNLVDCIFRILSVIISVLIVVNIVVLVPIEVKKVNFSKPTTADRQVKSIAPANSPDIYFIILDEYANSKTIKDIWNYNNSWFTNSLKDKGFYVAENSKTRYNQTYRSISSYLNMQYVDENASTLTCYQLISNNKAAKYLKEKGYKYVYIGNWYDANRYQLNADYQFNYFLDSDKTYIDEFALMLFKGTMVRPFTYLFETTSSGDSLEGNAIVYSFERLKQVSTMNVGGPKFVFAHILSPHAPFVFDKDGNKIDQADWYNWKEKKYYLGQYIYITKQVNNLVSELLKDKTNPPIIIIQSDHGPRPNYGPKPNQRMVIPENYMYEIFYSYYLPGLDNKIISQNMSPIYTFRLIFDKYFNEKLDLPEE